MTALLESTEIRTLTTQSHPDDWSSLDINAVDTARVLAADAVQKVGNGQPGTAMSLAPLAYSLFQKVMRHDPADPTWLAGTGSCARRGMTTCAALSGWPL